MSVNSIYTKYLEFRKRRINLLKQHEKCKTTQTISLCFQCHRTVFYFHKTNKACNTLKQTMNYVRISAPKFLKSMSFFNLYNPLG